MNTVKVQLFIQELVHLLHSTHCIPSDRLKIDLKIWKNFETSQWERWKGVSLYTDSHEWIAPILLANEQWPISNFASFPSAGIISGIN